MCGSSSRGMACLQWLRQILLFPIFLLDRMGSKLGKRCCKVVRIIESKWRDVWWTWKWKNGNEVSKLLISLHYVLTDRSVTIMTLQETWRTSLLYRLGILEFLALDFWVFQFYLWQLQAGLRLVLILLAQNLVEMQYLYINHMFISSMIKTYPYWVSSKSLPFLTTFLTESKAEHGNCFPKSMMCCMEIPEVFPLHSAVEVVSPRCIIHLLGVVQLSRWIQASLCVIWSCWKGWLA